jgi:hypothetical protein
MAITVHQSRHIERMPEPSSMSSYEAANRHPINRMLHLVGIPLIVVSLVAIVSHRSVFGWSGRLRQLRAAFLAKPKAPRAQTVADIAENLRQAEGELDLPGEA